MESVQTKLEKIKLLIQLSDEQLPLLSPDLINQKKVAMMLRMYFNDNEFNIFKNNKNYENYFEADQNLQNIQKIFQDYMKPNVNQIQRQKKQDYQMDERELDYKENNNFIGFLEYWIKKQPDLCIEYGYYDNIIRDSIVEFQSNLNHRISTKISNQKDNHKNVTKKQIIQHKKKLKTKKQHLVMNINQKISLDTNEITLTKNKSTLSSNSIVSQQRQQMKNSFRYYLRKFYQHYCKKFINSIKNKQFGVIQQFYNSMNLNKFMMYCKDIQLIKLNKKITVKFLTEKFKTNENKVHALAFQSFQNIVKDILEIAYITKEQIQSKGYEKIGVKDRSNFVQVMKKIGVNIPLKKIIFKEIKVKKSSQKLQNSKVKSQNMQFSRIFQQSQQTNTQLKNGGYNYGYQSNWNSNAPHRQLFLHQKQRKQQKLLQSLSIPKLNKLRPSQRIEEKLQQIVDDEVDPYLKRYNDKNFSLYSQSQNNVGMIKRIDERIQNVVKRIR